MAQKIIPHLWFDKEAKEAAAFYTSIFTDSKITNTTTITGTPSGDCDIVSFDLWGYYFMAISAGPYFKFNPSISFMINFDPSEDKAAKTRIDDIWNKLSDGGKVLMPIDQYPFSERYGWIQDKYGVSWQLILTSPQGEARPLVIPSLLFVTEGCDKAEEATNFYLSVFKNSPSAAKAKEGTKRGTIVRYPAGMPARAVESHAGGEPNKEGAIMFTDFMLDGQWFAAMDGSSKMHNFKFNEAVSLIINCKDQEEIDYFWEKLSAVPESDLPAPRPDGFYVYVILCGNGSMYIGQTQDIKKRWHEHDAGIAAEYTKEHKPIQLIHYEEFATREEAVKREQNLKTGFGRKWLQREYKAGRTRQAGQCGWVKDKYGVSWQIVPENMGELMSKNPQKVTPALLKMKKIIIADLMKAGEEK